MYNTDDLECKINTNTKYMNILKNYVVATVIGSATRAKDRKLRVCEILDLEDFIVLGARIFKGEHIDEKELNLLQQKYISMMLISDIVIVVTNSDHSIEDRTALEYRIAYTGNIPILIINEIDEFESFLKTIKKEQFSSKEEYIREICKYQTHSMYLKAYPNAHIDLNQEEN